jgi:hypothetical protein
LDSSHHDRLELQAMRRWRSTECLLLAIGEALAKFVCEEDFANVKACEPHSFMLMSPTIPAGGQEDGAAWRSAAIAPRLRIAIGSEQALTYWRTLDQAEQQIGV